MIYQYLHLTDMKMVLLKTELLLLKREELQLMFQSLYVADGKPQIGLAVTIVGGLANVALDYLFIAVFHMGIADEKRPCPVGVERLHQISSNP